VRVWACALTLSPLALQGGAYMNPKKKKKILENERMKNKCLTYLIAQGGEGYSECCKGRLMNGVTPGIYMVMVAQIFI
jgi:hypothetical protein